MKFSGQDKEELETPEQIETLEIPGADWFCTVAADGTIQRYLQEESE